MQIIGRFVRTYIFDRRDTLRNRIECRQKKKKKKITNLDASGKYEKKNWPRNKGFYFFLFRSKKRRPVSATAVTTAVLFLMYYGRHRFVSRKLPSAACPTTPNGEHIRIYRPPAARGRRWRLRRRRVTFLHAVDAIHYYCDHC